MYDPQQILDAVDHNLLPILLISILSSLGNLVYYIECLRLSFTQKVSCFPVGCIYLGLSHDLSFVFLYHKWFVEYHSWFLESWWRFLIFTSIVEFFFLYQLIRYGHEELMPQVSKTAFAAIVLAGLAMTSTAWLVVKSLLNDDIFMMTFFLSVFWQAPFFTGVMVRRQTRQGQSVVLWVSFLVMAASFWSLTYLYFGPFFRGVPWILNGIATLTWGGGNLWFMLRLPKAPVTRAAPAVAYPARA
jgi:hypothetical protein